MESDAALMPEDSSYKSSVLLNQQNIQKIVLDDLIDIERDLSKSEKISLIFLLYGSDKELLDVGIQHMLHISRNPASTETTFLYQWAKMQDGWREFLIEALCIQQSYHVTEKLHLDMKRLEEVYTPYRCGVSLKINRVIKSLFLMTERLLIKDMECLISYMRDKGVTKFDGTSNFLELHLLDWIRNGLIEVYTSVKIDFLYEFLKQSEIPDALEPLEPFVSKKIGSEKSEFDRKSDEYCYKIRREKCGWVLIINQKVFTKPDPATVPPGVQIEESLGERVGTDVDCDALKRVFSARGYKIEQRNNLTHIQMQKALHEIVDASAVYDSLIVCILSHGNKGIVFGSDYIPVNISSIQEILSSEKLLSKPKVLIVQACQGKQLNVTITSERSRSNLETDDASSGGTVSAPKYADLLTAMSTMEGFVSIRDRKLGTWYIREVCKSIDERGDHEHMLDLMTDVNNRVVQRRHRDDERELCMLPEFNSRLLKKMYLPKKSATL